MITGPSPTNSTWVPVSLRIADFISPSSNMQLTVIISDKPGTGNPLEGGFDVFEITEGPTGIDQVASNNFISVYPNPFTDFVEIIIEQSAITPLTEVVIYDVTGREVSRKNITATGNVKLDASKWHSGIFVARVIGSNVKIPVQKIVKY